MPPIGGTAWHLEHHVQQRYDLVRRADLNGNAVDRHHNHVTLNILDIERVAVHLQMPRNGAILLHEFSFRH